MREPAFAFWTWLAWFLSVAAAVAFLAGCGPPCHNIALIDDRGTRRCCYLCVDWSGAPSGTWHHEGKPVRGIHRTDLCECTMRCPCWTGYFRTGWDSEPIRELRQ